MDRGRTLDEGEDAVVGAGGGDEENRIEMFLLARCACVL